MSTKFPAIVTPHTDQIAGDTLTTITVNHLWREHVAALLTPCLYPSYWSGTQNDIDTAVNNARALLADLYTPGGQGPVIAYGCRLQIYQQQAIPATTWTEVGWTASTGNFVSDVHNMLPTDPEADFVNVSGVHGWYLVTVRINWFNSGVPTNRWIRFVNDFGDIIGMDKTYANEGMIQNFSCVFPVTQDDIFRIEVHSNTVGTLLATGNYPCQMTMTYLGDIS